jgi:peroxiredoxin
MGKQLREQLQAGDMAPDLRLELMGGGQERLRADESVLLVFFKISCPTCQYALPYLERVPPGIKVRGISQNDAADTREFADQYGLTFPILLDPEDRFPASNAFGITHVPTMFLLEPGGRIQKVIEGWNKRDMVDLGAVGAAENVAAWKAG